MNVEKYLKEVMELLYPVVKKRISHHQYIDDLFLPETTCQGFTTRLIIPEVRTQLIGKKYKKGLQITLTGFSFTKKGRKLHVHHKASSLVVLMNDVPAYFVLFPDAKKQSDLKDNMWSTWKEDQAAFFPNEIPHTVASDAHAVILSVEYPGIQDDKGNEDFEILPD